MAVRNQGATKEYFNKNGRRLKLLPDFLFA